MIYRWLGLLLAASVVLMGCSNVSESEARRQIADQIAAANSLLSDVGIDVNSSDWAQELLIHCFDSSRQTARWAVEIPLGERSWPEVRSALEDAADDRGWDWGRPTINGVDDGDVVSIDLPGGPGGNPADFFDSGSGDLRVGVSSGCFPIE